MLMPDNVKLKVGIKSNKGIRKENNDDRVLIGMDPSANDWLFSPDQTQLGEFGLLIMVADGIGDSIYSGEGAQILCQTIKQLFDQTLELPPDDDELIRILEKYVHVANNRILWHIENQENIPSLGVSFALGLFKSNKLYLVWCGNARVYRYQENGVLGSYFTDHPQFELLTADHTIETEYKLFAPKTEIPPNANSLKQCLGESTQAIHIASRVLSFYQDDKFLFSSEGLSDVVSANELANILSQNGEPQDIAGDLILAALNASASHNTTVSVIEIIEGSPAPILKQKDKETLLNEAKAFFGLTSTLIDAPTLVVERKKILAFNKITEKKEDVPIEPMKVRTVFPDVEMQEDVPIESPIVSPTENPIVPLVEQADFEMIEPENTTSAHEISKVPNQADNTNKDVVHQNEAVKEPSKLRIKVTVYPDSESNEQVETSKPDSTKIEPILETPNEQITEPADSNPDFEKEELVDKESEENEDNVSESQLENQEEEISEEVFPITQIDMFGVEQTGFDEENEESKPEILYLNEQDYDEVESMEQLKPEDNSPGFFDALNMHEDQEGIDEKESAMDYDGEDSNTKNSIVDSLSSFIEMIKPRWPYIAGIVIILLIGMWICNNKEEKELVPGQLNGNEVSIPKPEIDTKTPKEDPENKQKQEKIESTEEKKEQTKVEPDPKKVEKKEEKPKAPAIVSEPEYDAKIQQNKHQLLDEIVALWATKKELCKRITTYRKNAPAKKQEKLDALVYDCTQLEQKFSSIYDEKSGYFRTVRYDFLIGTITNIKVSLKQTEDKLEAIRAE
jgi:PPM family protein phosphatase